MYSFFNESARVSFLTCGFGGGFMSQKENKDADKAQKVQEEQAYGNETFGIPSDYTQKQKMSGFKLACYIVVVVAVCSLVYGGYRAATSYFLPEMTFDKSSQPLLYIKNSDVTLKTYGKKGKSVVKSDRLYKNQYAEEYVQITANGKWIFYAVDNSENVSGFDLYYQKTASIDDEDALEKAVCIDQGVTEYRVPPEGQFVLYLKEDRLYFSDLTESHIIASEVTEFYLSKNNQQIIYYKDGGKLYTCGTGLEAAPALVDTEIDKVLSEKDEYAKIYYLKQGSLYLKEAEKDRVLLAENVLDGVLLGDFVYFVRKEEKTLPYQELFFDDKAVQDAALNLPEKSDYFITDSSGETVFDETAYNAAVSRYDEKTARDAIRNYFKLNPVITEEYVLYTVKRNGVKKVDDGLSGSTIGYNGNGQAAFYRKEVKSEEKTRLSSLVGIEDALKKVDEMLEKDLEDSLYVLVKDKMPYLGVEQFPEGKIEVSLDGKFLYCLEDTDDNGRGTLVRYNISSRALKNKKELQAGVTDFAVDGTDSEVVVVFDGNRLGLCRNESYTQLSENSCSSFFYVDGSLFFYDDYNFDTQSGRLKLYRDGKTKLVDNNVHDFDVRNLKTVSYIKNYNPEFGFGDLYLKSGNKRGRKLDICVSEILN